MNKRDKKRLEVLQKKRQKLIGELSVVKRFTDDPAEIPKLEAELAQVEAEIATIRAG